MSLILVGDRESTLSVWSYPNSGGATPTWTADTGGNTTAVATDSSGNIYVVGAVASSKNLWKYTSAGALTASLLVGGGAIELRTVALDSSNVLYVGGDNLSGTTCSWTVDNDITTATAFGANSSGTCEKILVSPSDYICRLVLSTSLRALTFDQYNTSLTQLNTAFVGVGTDIVSTQVFGTTLTNDNFVFGYGRGGSSSLYHVDGTTWSTWGVLDLQTESSVAYNAVYSDSDDVIYLSVDTEVRRYDLVADQFTLDWTDTDPANGTSVFIESTAGTLFNFLRIAAAPPEQELLWPPMYLPLIKLPVLTPY